MRLYSRAGATAVDDGPDSYEPGPDGGFDFPEALAARLHAVHDGGVQVWENSIEKQQRLIAEEAARRADPATLLAAVEQLVAAAHATAPAEPAPAKAAPKTAAKANVK